MPVRAQRPHHGAVLHHLDGRGAEAEDRQQLGLEHALLALAVVQRVQHHAGRAPLGEGHLLDVDEAPLEREGEQHAEHRQHRHPHHRLPPGDDGAGDQHVSGQARDQRRRHVAGGGRDRLRAVVLEDRQVAPGADRAHHAEGGEGQDHRGDADPQRPAGLRADVEVGQRQDAAEEEAGEAGAERQLRQVAAVDVLQPPLVLLLRGPVADLLRGELLDCHGELQRRGGGPRGDLEKIAMPWGIVA